MSYGKVGLTEIQLCKPKEVALALGLRYCAVCLIIRKYLKMEGVLLDKLPRKPSSRQPKITPALATYLLEPETLKSWRGWSMARRVF
jgi:hypothetical protein